MLVLFLIVIVVVLFYQKEQMDILQMFSVADCKDSTPTTKQMDDLVFNIFMMSNILLRRESKIPKNKSFFKGNQKLKNFLQQTLKQQRYFEWKDFSEKIVEGTAIVNHLYSLVKLNEFSKNLQQDVWVGNILTNPLQVDSDFQYSVSQNMIEVVDNYFSKQFYTDTVNLGPTFELTKELFNYTHCYCKQVNPYVMLIQRPNDYKYCKSMSLLLFYNSIVNIIGAFIIVITNMTLHKFINFLFEKVFFKSNSNKSTAKVLTISMALFFNTLVSSFHCDINLQNGYSLFTL